TQSVDCRNLEWLAAADCDPHAAGGIGGDVSEIDRVWKYGQRIFNRQIERHGYRRAAWVIRSKNQFLLVRPGRGVGFRRKRKAIGDLPDWRRKNLSLHVDQVIFYDAGDLPFRHAGVGDIDRLRRRLAPRYHAE